MRKVTIPPTKSRISVKHSHCCEQVLRMVRVSINTLIVPLRGNRTPQKTHTRKPTTKKDRSRSFSILYNTQ